MIGRALDADISFAWVAGDSVYGVGDLEMALRRTGKGFVLGVNANHWFYSWRPDVMWVAEAREIINTLPDEAWVRCSAGHGTKGERWYDWLYCPMADLHASEYADTLTGTWTRGLLVRRNPADGDLRYFITWCPQGTPLETLARVEGARWRIEEGFETAKNEFGLDHNETRSWHGWHRHVSLVMLAHAMMAAVRSQANVLTLKKSPRPTRKSSSGGRSRKSDASP